MSHTRNDDFTRRHFLQTTTAAAAGITTFNATAFSAPPTTQPKPLLAAGVLGRTQYPATLISFGAILLAERLGTRILRAAIDRGVNLVHTSSSYTNGKSIRSVGALFKADKSYRDKVFLCVKCFHPEKETEVDDMLRLLHTDHIDVVLTTLHDPQPRRLSAIQAQQDKLKKKGKARHTGFTCHRDMNGVIELVLNKAADYFDVTLMSMTMAPVPGSPKDDDADVKGQRFLKNLKALRQKGVGVLSMKSGARTAVKKGPAVFQPHAKVTLAAGADTVLTSIDSFQQIEMITKLDLKSPHLNPREQKAAADFHRYRANACLMCGDCNKGCPQHIPVSDLMRIRMYHQEYGWGEHARAEYDALRRHATAIQSTPDCGNCSQCADICPVGLASPQTVRQITDLFT